ncbi:hypothetical protein N481_08090 [Pseudoalteromonas luteoviolacea S4047-1]|uniref:Uncharacterized protein n=1 Tax=Pseudoalteromonas luteoviolacea S4054 TaxID=1129367 RepID=A0A0F6AAJ8_9GAMM|nr:hypothetical protein N479_16395 [Pseudoalteromonas luteoviolacea S4054]KZN75268.1 hypothetical protein N481_08090 [Pseudoalteromonas luteoviolacea S4047-1]
MATGLSGLNNNKAELMWAFIKDDVVNLKK